MYRAIIGVRGQQPDEGPQNTMPLPPIVGSGAIKMEANINRVTANVSINFLATVDSIVDSGYILRDLVLPCLKSLLHEGHAVFWKQVFSM